MWWTLCRSSLTNCEEKHQIPASSASDREYLQLTCCHDELMQWLDGMMFTLPLACQLLDVMNIVPLQSDKLWRKALDTSQFCFWSRVFAADLLSWWVDAMTRWHGVYLATSMSTTRCDEHCATPVWQIVKKSTRYQPVLLLIESICSWLVVMMSWCND